MADTGNTSASSSNDATPAPTEFLNNENAAQSQRPVRGREHEERFPLYTEGTISVEDYFCRVESWLSRCGFLEEHERFDTVFLYLPDKWFQEAKRTTARITSDSARRHSGASRRVFSKRPPKGRTE